MRFHTTADISQHRALTPEGFLVCSDVTIARIGNQTYFTGEVPVTPDVNGSINIMRDAEEVFHPSAIASFEGKPITMQHPDEAVTPDNWKEHAIGHVQNVRQGIGLEADTLKADFVIMDKDAIKEVTEDRIREVSCGYDADYAELGPGSGKQQNIRGNHVALVTKGRCGSLCAVHDSDTAHKKEGGSMKVKELFAKMKSALTADEQKELGLVTDAATLTIDQRMDRIEKSVGSIVKMFKDAAEEEEKKAVKDKRGKDGEEPEEMTDEFPEEKEEKKAAKDKRGKDEFPEEKEKKEAKDCAAVKDAAPIVQDVLYRASILAPELKPFTTDAIKSKKTLDEACCLHKRRSLDHAGRTEDGKAAITPFTGGSMPDFFTADCGTVDLAFAGASELLKRSSAANITHKTSDFMRGGITPAQINARNTEVWAGKAGK